MSTQNSQHTTSRKILRTLNDLQQHGLLAEQEASNLHEVAQRYVIAVTPDMVDCIDKHDHLDPIAQQFIPDRRELIVLPQEDDDPIGDAANSPLKALVHRHKNRVLLKPTLACAVYCRFCFRREMVGPSEEGITQKDVDDALDYIAAHDAIEEVILTGGDPLILSAQRLQKLMEHLHAIDHVRRIRLHTRIPVVASNKITDVLVAALAGIKPVFIAIHANHAREFTSGAATALARLANAGIVLLGQSVLLKGINNNVESLVDLCETMLDHRIKPYYLHHPDLTVGTSHFRLTLEEGMDLMDALRDRVSGLAVPQYTLDIPNGLSTKIALHRGNVKPDPQSSKAGDYILRAPNGQEYRYSDLLKS